MKTIFILAGFGVHNDASHSEHSFLLDGLKNKGYDVIPVTISWLRKTPSQYTKEFIDFFMANKSDYNIVIGNSFGAVIAALSAPSIKPDEIYLCSLSPFFKEDKHFRPDSYWIRHFGKRRLNDLRSTSFTELAEQIKKSDVKTTVIHGDKEYKTSPPLVRRCEDASQRISGTKPVVFKNTPHNMSDSNYAKQLINLF